MKICISYLMLPVPSFFTDCRQFSGPLRNHKKDGTQSLIYSKEVESSYPESTTSLLTVFTYKKIKKITRNFKHTISAGRFKTYRGTISKDLRLGPEHLQVAVKIYDDDTFCQDKHNWLVGHFGPSASFKLQLSCFLIKFFQQVYLTLVITYSIEEYFFLRRHNLQTFAVSSC